MDRQARKLHRGAEDGGAGSDAASDMGSNSDSENEEKVFESIIILFLVMQFGLFCNFYLSCTMYILHTVHTLILTVI